MTAEVLNFFENRRNIDKISRNTEDNSRSWHHNDAKNVPILLEASFVN
jgi:hypothetical protein